MKCFNKYLYFIILFLFGFQTKLIDALSSPLTYLNLPEKHITVVIPSFNNQAWYKRNLDSILEQKYSNYNVIYIDDCSRDNTSQLVEEYLKKHAQGFRVKLVKNSYRKGALENLWQSIHNCSPTDIIATIDGDDFLDNNDSYIFQKLNTLYSTNNIWLTYGQFQMSSNGSLGWCTPMPNDVIAHNSYRSHQNIPSHLRTFYAALYHKIALKDLIYRDSFYPMAWDIAMMIPMIEMAGKHHYFVDTPWYIYNDETPINDHKVNKQYQSYLARLLRSKSSYMPLENLMLEQMPDKKTSIVIFSEESPWYLAAMLNSLQKYMPIKDIHVIYKTKDEKIRKLYEHIAEQFRYIQLHRVNPRIPYYLKYQAPKLIASLECDYIFVAHDNALLTNYVSIDSCIKAMEKTHAYGFYLRQGKNITYNASSFSPQKLPPLFEIEPGIYAWKFCDGEGDWAYPSNFDITLYKKADFLKAVSSGHFNDSSSLEIAWGSNIEFDQVGLCFEHSLAVKIVPKKETGTPFSSYELTEAYEQGYYFDEKFITNTSPTTCVDYILPININLKGN